MFAFQHQVTTVPSELLRQCENRRKARRADQCKKLRIFINSTPGVGRGGYQSWTKLHPGNSLWVLLRQGLCGPEAQPLCPAGKAVPTGAQHTGYRKPCWPTAVGCRFLLIQVGWDPSLIFDFNKLVRIYFFVCSVSTYVDYYKSM